MVAAIAASVAFPLAGTAVAIIALIALRAGDRTGRRLARRRSRQGRRPGDRSVAAAFFPLALCGSALRFLLVAPLGILGAGVVAAITIIAVPAHPLPRAFSCGAGALVAYYGIGPGSGGCRRPLSKLFGPARASIPQVCVAIAVTALAVAAVVLAVSEPPFFWPSAHLGTQFAAQPALHSVMTDIRATLFRLIGRSGF
jgi:hypothetical protein